MDPLVARLTGGSRYRPRAPHAGSPIEQVDPELLALLEEPRSQPRGSAANSLVRYFLEKGAARERTGPKVLEWDKDLGYAVTPEERVAIELAQTADAGATSSAAWRTSQDFALEELDGALSKYTKLANAGHLDEAGRSILSKIMGARRGMMAMGMPSHKLVPQLHSLMEQLQISGIDSHVITPPTPEENFQANTLRDARGVQLIQSYRNGQPQYDIDPTWLTPEQLGEQVTNIRKSWDDAEQGRYKTEITAAGNISEIVPPRPMPAGYAMRTLAESGFRFPEWEKWVMPETPQEALAAAIQAGMPAPGLGDIWAARGDVAKMQPAPEDILKHYMGDQSLAMDHDFAALANRAYEEMGGPASGMTPQEFIQKLMEQGKPVPSPMPQPGDLPAGAPPVSPPGTPATTPSLGDLGNYLKGIFTAREPQDMTPKVDAQGNVHHPVSGRFIPKPKPGEPVSDEMAAAWAALEAKRQEAIRPKKLSPARVQEIRNEIKEVEPQAEKLLKRLEELSKKKAFHELSRSESKEYEDKYDQLQVLKEYIDQRSHLLGGQ